METNKITDLDVHTSLYDATLMSIAALQDQETGRINIGKDDQERIETKYKIMRITSKFGLLMSMISAFEGFEIAFLKSSSNRHLFIQNEEIKVNSKSGTIIKKGEDDYDQSEYPQWIKWKGCEMSIPKEAYITLTPSASWPTVFMKTKNELGDSCEEITIYERAWNADVFTSGEGLIKHKSPDGEKELSRITAIHANDSKFSKISLEVQRKLEDFTIVIEFPFLTPSLDVLTEVSFVGDAEGGEVNDIVLTTFS